MWQQRKMVQAAPPHIIVLSYKFTYLNGYFLRHALHRLDVGGNAVVGLLRACVCLCGGGGLWLGVGLMMV